MNRVILIVLDGVGAGAAPDAAAYGDAGAHTLAHTARLVGGLHLPNLARLGLGSVTPIEGVPVQPTPHARHGRLCPAAAGKDSTTGHWEMMGCVVSAPFPTYPHGFPPELVARFETRIGRKVLGNTVASGTSIIEALGREHMESGRPILYTSADSVFQVAAHESIVPLETLYDWCREARALLVPPHAVGRVIARPFVGEPGGFHRTANRRDFSLAPTRPTVLDALVAAGKRVLAIGKIDDLFAGRGITSALHTRDNRDGMARTLEATRAHEAELIFVNLVDFDTLWGHRNDARAFALGLEDFDAFLAGLLPELSRDDVLILTADHGNDPTTEGTDHTRECVPLLIHGACVEEGARVEGTLSDVGATVAALLGVNAPAGRPVALR